MSKSEDKIVLSYILPTMNRPEHLEKIINKIKPFLNETNEIIIIDGSKQANQNVSNILNGKNYNYVNESDNNDVEAINKGILISQGEVIKVLGDDDEWDYEKIEKSCKILLENKIDVLSCGGIIYDEINKNEKFINIPSEIEYSKDKNNLLKYSLSGFGLIFKKLVLAKTGLWQYPTCDAAFIFESMINKDINFKFCRINVCYHKFSEDNASFKNYYGKLRMLRELVYKNFSIFTYAKFALKHNKIYFNMKKNNPFNSINFFLDLTKSKKTLSYNKKFDESLS